MICCLNVSYATQKTQVMPVDCFFLNYVKKQVILTFPQQQLDVAASHFLQHSAK